MHQLFATLGRRVIQKIKKIPNQDRRRSYFLIFGCRHHRRPFPSAMSFVQSFLRSSRAALRQRGTVNPFQQTLGVQGSNQYLNSWRNYATAFERNKPHVNIGE